jgi:lincosamide nucleotidyltransferase B/F
MKLEQFRAFSKNLKANLETDNRVLGLVFLGSAAEQDRIPDEYSDHDFFVITLKGMQEEFRQNLSWLPDAANIVIKYRETEHGLKIIFANGHLIEFAIFDEEELFLARVNDYRVDLDKAQITTSLQQIAAKPFPDFDPQKALNGFLSELLIGLRRCNRGEKISGKAFIKQYSFYHLMRLLSHYLPAANKQRLDNLDPMRRFELVFPELGSEINAALLLEGQDAARLLLTIADRELRERMPNYPTQAVEFIRSLTT